MNKIILKHFIKNEILNITEAEASKKDIFGQYLFAPVRTDLSKEERKETNTESESELFNALASHYTNDPGLNKFIPLLLQLIKSKKYLKILRPPAKKAVYRIIGPVNVKIASSILGISSDVVKTQQGIVKNAPGGIMKPGGPNLGQSGVHSWTLKLNDKWIKNDLYMGFFSEIPKK